MDPGSNLKIKGYGDPLLISEVLVEIVNHLATRIDTTNTKINDLILDDSYFKAPIVIPGVTSSDNPYDAPNGALCVNFNTVAFRRNSNGTYVSAEPQTPLLPFALSKINKTLVGKGRIILSTKNSDITLYTGHLLFYFMQKKGFELSGGIRMGKVHKEDDQLILNYKSRFTLEKIVAKMLEHSNNFVSNQLLIAAGAKVYGPPGTLEKGVHAAHTYAKNNLEINDIHIVEGSGISKKNRISAKSLYKTLKAFLPYHSLMHQTGRMSYKTGTLHGVNTRAGYVENTKGELYCFVVLINTPGKSPKRIMEIILKAIE
jgi:D-alanyl-D-alanine carboxypeptidase/D-alanyl-D-alanine-endopeptidase (penicillin-binding protein 4)